VVNEYQLGELVGQMVGGAIPPAVIAFLVTRKQTKGAVPYIAALVGALAGVGAVFGFNLVAHRLGSSDAVVHKMEENFSTSCVRSCTAAKATDAQCRALCGCVLNGLHTRYPTNEQFVRWMRESDSQSESVKKEAVELSTNCLPAARSAGATQ